MKFSHKHFIDLLISTFFSLTVFSLGTVTSNAHPHLTTESKVAVNGIGPILIGMTVEEAEAAAGVKLSPAFAEEKYSSDLCRYYYPDNELEGISFVISLEDNKIQRLEIENQKISTLSGVTIGDTEEYIRFIYPGRISQGIGFYGGKYLLYKPKTKTYEEYRILFNIYEGHMTKFRIATKDWIGDLVEACS